jgi:predicted dehydrogenase
MAKPCKTIALIGHGIWGALILRDLQALDHSVWVVDPNDHARQAARARAAGCVATFEDLPVQIDGWIVATPAVTHEKVVLAALARGGPVLCEKPLTTDSASARRMVDAGGDRLFVGHIWCYHPGVELLATIAQSGELGPVTLLRSWRVNWTSPRQDVDTGWNLAPHDIALAQFILGCLPSPIAAFAEVQAGRCVGLIGILGRNPSAVFEVSNRYGDKRREIRLHCRDGVAVLPDADCATIEIIRSDGVGNAVRELRPFTRESALKRELAAFCTHLDGGPPPKTPASDGLAVVETLVELRRLAGI